jgi:hypothetical protein
MKIFSLSRHARSKPAWSYVAHGSIWRILFSSTGQIVGECREHQQKQATVFCLEEMTGAVRWHNVRLKEPWWIGIETVYRTTVLLHEFANPSMPEHRGIIALDLNSGRELWHNTELTFWFVYENWVYAYKPQFEQRVGFKLALETGEPVEEYRDASSTLEALRRRAMEEQRNQEQEYHFPEQVEERALEPNIASLVRMELHGTVPQGAVEYIRQDPYLLMNYYTAARSSKLETPLLENRFVIYDIGRRKKIFSELLSQEATAPTPDSFFIKSGTVFFIQNQNILTAVRLVG